MVIIWPRASTVETKYIHLRPAHPVLLQGWPLARQPGTDSGDVEEIAERFADYCAGRGRLCFGPCFDCCS